MVARSLDDNLIKAGSELIKILDANRIAVDAAFWFYFTDLDDWKLILSLPILIRKGPRAAYEKIQKSNKELAKKGIELPLSLVTVAKRDAQLIALLRVAIKTGPGISSIRFSKNTINGQVIEDAYIYRL